MSEQGEDTMKAGDMVETLYGEVVLVIDIWDNIITTDKGIYHISKLVRNGR